MSIGRSGRIVIEVDPGAKRRLYAALARDGLTLKDWFLQNAELYLNESGQLPLSFSKGDSTAKTDSGSKSINPQASRGDT